MQWQCQVALVYARGGTWHAKWPGTHPTSVHTDFIYYLFTNGRLMIV